MKLTEVVVMGLLLTFVSVAQGPPREWADRTEYEMATGAVSQKDIFARVSGLLAWEAAYPNSQLAPERTEQLIIAYQQVRSLASGKDQIAIPLLYKVVVLGVELQNRSADQVRVIHQAATDLLEELKENSAFAPADAEQRATRALALEVL